MNIMDTFTSCKRQLFVFFALTFMFTSSTGQAQETTQYTGPIIDMHLHAYNEGDYWGGKRHPMGVVSPKTSEEHLSETQAFMDKYNIKKAVIDGRSVQTVTSYLINDDRFLPGYNDNDSLLSVERFEEMVKNGIIKVFGEVSAVYKGRTLNDPMYEPYLKICEEYDIPVAYHTGGSAPMTPYNCCPDFRISLGDPLLIEDVLVKYPDLKIYLMHGGEVFYEHAIRMMHLYRQLYIDLGVMLWVDPIVKNYAVRMLKLAKDAGVLDRVMFGTDQMVWPGAISKAVDFLNTLDFLTREDKANIFYNNAARFLELSEEEIASHHGSDPERK